jgi:Fe-S oxidoreductase
MHITEFLVEHLKELKFKSNGDRHLTFQDPCRLGRHLGIYDPPRELLAALPGVKAVEMRRTKASAACCGGGTWTHCDRYSKRIQVERLLEARTTGAAVMVTACPKCRIHLRCAMKDPNLQEEIEMETRDITEIVASLCE